MAKYRLLSSLTQYPVPALATQRRITSIFANTPGETVQPFPYWLENVIPTQRGIKSISWQIGAAVAPPQLQGLPATIYYFPTAAAGFQQAVFTNNQFWLYDILDNVWEMAQDLPNATRLPTRAYIRNESYVFLNGVGLRKVTEAGLQPVTLNWGTGVTPPDDLIGCSNNTGYLLLYSQSRVYWSSPLDPTVFSISEGGVSTGAGSTLVQGLAGNILCIEPIAGGAIIYTNQVAFSMRYTTNALVPFAFAPVQGCRGVVRQWHITHGDNTDTHFLWSVAGLQQLSLGKADYMFPEFTAYFARNILHSLEGVEVIETFADVDVKIGLLSGDLLTFSIGPVGFPFRYFWVYDIQLQRWGRVEKEHWHVAIKIPVSNDTSTTYESMALLGTKISQLRSKSYTSLRGDVLYSSERPLEFTYYGSDGLMHHADFADFSIDSGARVIIGDYRVTQNRVTEINEVTLRASGPEVNVEVVDQDSVSTLFFNAGNGRYCERANGDSLAVIISGDFELTDALITLVPGGGIR